MDFFEHQADARKQTGRLVTLFLLAVLLTAFAVNTVAFAFWHWFISEPELSLKNSFIHWLSTQWSFAILALVFFTIFIGSFLQWLSLKGGGAKVAEMAGATPVDYQSSNLKVKQFINTAEEMAIASGTPVPDLYVMENESGINAFVAGYQTEQAVLVVTQGLLDNLDRDQIQGVIGHEYSHVLNGDMRLNVKLIAILSGLLAIGQFGRFIVNSQSYRHRGGWFYSGSVSSVRNRNSSSGTIPLILGGFALIIIGAIGVFFGRMIKAAVSRQREFLADASAVQFTRNPDGIAGALYQIRELTEGSYLTNRHAEDMSHLCFGESVVLKRFRNRLATHPPLTDRIRRVSPHYLTKQQHKDKQDINKDVADTNQDTQINTTHGAAVTMASFAVASVGQPTPTHVEYAQKLHKDIPESVKMIIRTSSGSRAFCYILIMKVSEGHEQRILDQIKPQDPEAVAPLSKLWPWQKTMPASYRLPILDMAIPVLRRHREEDILNLLKRLDQFIKADGQVHLREWVLRSLLRIHLRQDSVIEDKTSIKSLTKLKFEIQTLLSALVYHSSDRQKAEQACKMAFINLGLENTWLLSPKAIDYSKLFGVLVKLRKLNFMLRQPVLQACADILMADDQVNVDEYEFLRVVSDTLGCPMPPLVDLEIHHRS